MGCCASGAPVGILFSPKAGKRWRRGREDEGALVEDKTAVKIVLQGKKFSKNPTTAACPPETPTLPTSQWKQMMARPEDVVSCADTAESLLAGVVLQVESSASLPTQVPQKRPIRKAVTWGPAEVCEYEPRRNVRRTSFVRGRP